MNAPLWLMFVISPREATRPSGFRMVAAMLVWNLRQPRSLILR